MLNFFIFSSIVRASLFICFKNITFDFWKKSVTTLLLAFICSVYLFRTLVVYIFFIDEKFICWCYRHDVKCKYSLLYCLLEREFWMAVFLNVFASSFFFLFKHRHFPLFSWTTSFSLFSKSAITLNGSLFLLCSECLLAFAMCECFISLIRLQKASLKTGYCFELSNW